MEIILFEDKRKEQFLPITYTRPIFEIRIGILTIQEKWSLLMGQEVKGVSSGALAAKFPWNKVNEETLIINAAYFPTPDFLLAVKKLETGNCLKSISGELIAAKMNVEIANLALTGIKDKPAGVLFFDFIRQNTTEIIFDKPTQSLEKLTDTFTMNGAEIVEDFNRISKYRKSETITDEFTKIYSPEKVFVESGVAIRAAVINASKGPVYIGKNAEIQENAVIIGPACIGEGAVVNIGAKIRQDTTIGPFCKVGGEVSNVVFQAYSNKGHDGFLGNSYIGEWCNLGADTNNSNLKNNYSEVKIYSHVTQKQEDTGLTFCGLIMGDYSKAGINTMFNTGTVTGVCANIFDAGFPPKFIPSFSWGGAKGFETYQLEKAYEAADKMMQRRKLSLTEADKQILAKIFEMTKSQRNS